MEEFRTAEEQLNPKQSAPIMSVKDWVITLLIMIIPIVNIVFLIIWAFGNDNALNPSKRNWAKAQLIFMVIGIIISILSFIVIGAFGLFALSSQGHY